MDAIFLFLGLTDRESSSKESNVKQGSCKNTELATKRSVPKRTGNEIGGSAKVWAEMVAPKRRDPHS